MSTREVAIAPDINVTLKFEGDNKANLIYQVTDGIDLLVDLNKVSIDQVQQVIAKLKNQSQSTNRQISTTKTIAIKSPYQEFDDLIKENQIGEKLANLKTQLSNELSSLHLTFEAPALHIKQDPHFIIHGFNEHIKLQVKVQLTGKKCVLNLMPNDAKRKSKEDFLMAIHQIQLPYQERKGGMYGLYAPTHDFKTKAEGFKHGIDLDDVATVAKMIADAISRLQKTIR